MIVEPFRFPSQALSVGWKTPSFSVASMIFNLLISLAVLNFLGILSSPLFRKAPFYMLPGSLIFNYIFFQKRRQAALHSPRREPDAAGNYACGGFRICLYEAVYKKFISGQFCFFHLLIHPVNAFSKFLHIIILMQDCRDFRVA